MVPPPEGRRRGLRRLRRRREEPDVEAAAEAAPVEDETVTAEVDAVAEPEPKPEAPGLTPEQAAAAQLEARFDAARERLRATITPPDPD